MKGCRGCQDRPAAANQSEVEGWASCVQIQRVRESAAAEAAQMQQKLQAAQAEQEREAAEVQSALQARVAGLEKELFTLKDRYSRQFIDYKQRLDASEARARRLRHELEQRGGTAEPDGAAAVPPAAPPGSGGSSVEDVSTWASHLVSKLSEESGAGVLLWSSVAGQHSVQQPHSERTHGLLLCA